MNPTPNELRKDKVLRAVFADWLEERMETARAARVRAGCFCDGEVVEEYGGRNIRDSIAGGEVTFAEGIEHWCHVKYDRHFYTWWKVMAKVVFVAHGNPNCLPYKPEFEELIRISAWGQNGSTVYASPGNRLMDMWRLGVLSRESWMKLEGITPTDAQP